MHPYTFPVGARVTERLPDGETRSGIVESRHHTEDPENHLGHLMYKNDGRERYHGAYYIVRESQHRFWFAPEDALALQPKQAAFNFEQF